MNIYVRLRKYLQVNQTNKHSCKFFVLLFNCHIMNGFWLFSRYWRWKVNSLWESEIQIVPEATVETKTILVYGWSVPTGIIHYSFLIFGQTITADLTRQVLRDLVFYLNYFFRVPIQFWSSSKNFLQRFYRFRSCICSASLLMNYL